MTTFLATVAASFLPGAQARADGCFVFVWDKAKDINEPTQKAILLHDRGREDLVLQVKYEGLAQDFGWLIPVPGLPEVRRGSMDCFYELSRLTQQRFRDDELSANEAMTLGRGGLEPVKVIEIKTVGAYEVAVLSTRDAGSLEAWLDAHQFVFPKEKRDVLDGYVRKQWYFVAIRVNPERSGFALKSGLPKKPTIAPQVRKQLAKGELHPLVLSFASEKCLFPLAISSVNGKPSEISLYLLSPEPLASVIIVDKEFEAFEQARAKWIADRPKREKQLADSQKRREELIRRAGQDSPRIRDSDPNDPPPDLPAMRRRMVDRYLPARPAEAEEDYYGGNLVQCTEVRATALPACARELPRLAGKQWWLTKQVRTFAPEEMRDLEFEPVIPMLAAKLHLPEGYAAAFSLGQFGAKAVPVLLDSLQRSDSVERRHALSALGEFRFPSHSIGEPGESSASTRTDPRLAGVLMELLADTDAPTRAKACGAAANYWDPAFVRKLTSLLLDPEPGVRSAACSALERHREDLVGEYPTYKKMVSSDGPAAAYAIRLAGPLGGKFTREESLRFLSSTNLPVVSMGFSQLRGELEPRDLRPLLTNPLPMARLMGLGELARIGNKPAVELLVSMLHDPDETVRWRVRSSLRQLSGRKLGPDPAAYEQWWAKAKDTFTAAPQSRRQR